jgi:hypothetical protein
MPSGCCTRVWSVFVAIVTLVGCSVGGPHNVVLDEIRIPEHGTKLIIFERGAGAASALLTMVSLEPIDYTLRDRDLGNLFRGEYVRIVAVDIEDRRIDIQAVGADESVLL